VTNKKNPKKGSEVEVKGTVLPTVDGCGLFKVENRREEERKNKSRQGGGKGGEIMVSRKTRTMRNSPRGKNDDK